MAKVSNRTWLLAVPLVLAAFLLAGCYTAVTSTPTIQPTLKAAPTRTPLASATPAPGPSATAAPTAQPLRVKLTRGPYLQLVTQAGVTVVWETDVPFASRVDYGPTDKYGLTAGNSTPVTHHVVTLDSLKPYSQVHYRLSADGQALSEAFTFRTAASPDQPQFTFVAFGDTRSDLVAHQKVVSSILTLAPDFLLHTGDMVADGSSASDWTTFFSVERRLLAQAPMYGVLGNHEHGSPFYFEAFDFPGNGRWYSFDYGNVHFVALQIDREGGFAADSEQARWLENDLAQTHQPWKMVFFHIPPHSSALHRGDEQVRAALEPILTKYHVDLVFNGHDHDYERLMTKGIVYIVTGGGGAPLYPKTLTDPASAYFTSTHHAVWVTVNGLRLNLAGVQTDGVRFDEFALKKVSPNAPAVFVK